MHFKHKTFSYTPWGQNVTPVSSIKPSKTSDKQTSDNRTANLAHAERVPQNDMQESCETSPRSKWVFCDWLQGVVNWRDDLNRRCLSEASKFLRSGQARPIVCMYTSGRKWGRMLCSSIFLKTHGRERKQPKSTKNGSSIDLRNNSSNRAFYLLAVVHTTEGNVSWLTQK